MKKIIKIIFSILILLLVLIWAEIVKNPAPADCAIYFFDVDQGDSALIQKGDYQILIDGGPSNAVLEKLGETMPLSDRTIEQVILSHPHADHITGLNSLFDRYQIEKIYITGVVSTSSAYLEFLQKLKDKKIETSVPKIGESNYPFENATETFLWPGEKYKEKEIENLNNSSAVMQFCYFKNCALFTGDIETDAQKTMFENIQKIGLSPESKILKIAHHGSQNGTDSTILDAVKPEFAIIDVGANNTYGHPHQIVIDLLEKANIKTLRTDQNGDATFLLSADNIILK